MSRAAHIANLIFAGAFPSMTVGNLPAGCRHRLRPPGRRHRQTATSAGYRRELTLNTGKHPDNQPAQLAQLDDGNDRVILVQGDEG
jgi:hypothetical protein